MYKICTWLCVRQHFDKHQKRSFCNHFLISHFYRNRRSKLQTIIIVIMNPPSLRSPRHPVYLGEDESE